MSVRLANAAEMNDWTNLLRALPGGYCFLQDLPFAAAKAPVWQPRPLIHEIGGVRIPVLYLVRRLPVVGETWYAPAGPRVDDPALFAEICRDVFFFARHAFDVVLEPSIPASGPHVKADLVTSIPTLRETADIQPTAHTVVVDLSLSEAELLASFRQRTRRVLRKTNDAVVEHVEDERGFEPMWRLLQAMSDRAAYPLRDQQYYWDFWRRYLDLGQGHFVLLRPHADADYAAGAFLVRSGEDCYYKDGGSTRVKGANGLQYLVQWESMKWAKALGVLRYDMLGTPASWNAADPSERLYGLVQFKTGFGTIQDQAGAVRLVRQPRAAWLWDRVGVHAFNWGARRSGAQFY